MSDNLILASNFLEHKLNSWAAKSFDSKGRKYREKNDAFRPNFLRDRDRIIHSKSFRRLKGKTQVFPFPANDHLRTRLSHSLEVAGIAKTIARLLCCNEDLVEAIALVHDIGHPPLGHVGEEILNGLIKARRFDHNLQALRIVVILEKEYPNFSGLNLTFETLEGIIKHNGPIEEKDLGIYQKYLAGKHLKSLLLQGSIECQIATIADDIAYVSHDVYDGLKANILQLDKMMNSLPLIKDIIDEIVTKYGLLSKNLLFKELARKLIDIFVRDVLSTSSFELSKLGKSFDINDVRNHHKTIINFGIVRKKQLIELKRYLYDFLYQSQAVLKEIDNYAVLIGNIFSKLKEDHTKFYVADNSDLTILDYIGGMTDSYLINLGKKKML